MTVSARTSTIPALICKDVTRWDPSQRLLTYPLSVPTAALGR